MKKEYGPLMVPSFDVDDHYYTFNSGNTDKEQETNNNNQKDNKLKLSSPFSLSSSLLLSSTGPFYLKSNMKLLHLTSMFVLVCLLFLLLPMGTNALNCYQCYSNNLDPCPYEDYRPCPGLHNRCAIRTRRVHTGELFVKRECSLGCGDGIDTWSTRDLNVSWPIFT